MALRTRNAAVLLKIQSAAQTFEAPSASTDGLLVEAPRISFNGQNVDTDEVTGSLDGRGPIIGGLQAQLGFSIYLKGSGTPGLAPEFGEALRCCGLAETSTATNITATTIAFTDANTVTDSGAGLAAITVGTPVYLSGSANAANVGEFLCSASAAGSLDFTKLDGTSPGFTAEAAGASITLKRGIAAVAATAGTTTAFTAQAPWAATVDLYRHMPVLLSGNPATAAFAFLSDYTAGRVGTITDLMGSALTTSTLVAIPANVRYVPGSTSIPMASMELYMDGKRWRLSDCRGSVRFTFEAARGVKAEFTFSGLYVSVADAAVPSVTYDGTRPGTFRASKYLVQRVPAAIQSLSVDFGNQLVFPENPNAAEGFDGPEIVRRAITGSMNPLATLVATQDLMTAFRSGTEHILHGRILGGLAANAGQRIGITAQQAFYTANNPGDRQGLATDEIAFFARGQDSAVGLSFY